MENEERVTRKRSEKRKRIRSVFVRLTEDEYRHASEQASTAGMKPPRLARELMNGAYIRPAKKLPEEVYRAVISFGNNLNQLARAMNTSSFNCGERLDALRAEVASILTCLSRS